MSASSAGARLHGATVLVTGGAGFIGSRVSVALAEQAAGIRVVALDNLRRRGSELNLPYLRAHGVEFVRGDVREAGDLARGGREPALIVDCAAETSVLAGDEGTSREVVETNLVGTVNCLETARRTGAKVIFLSTNRVYPIARLNAIDVVEAATRFDIAAETVQPGVSAAGVSERFPLEGVRSLYGATKLASELLIREYGAAFGVEYVINRFGVVSGSGQMGKVEQGVFALWMARHVFGGALTYRGWGGAGKQVRDLLHVDDVWRALELQIEHWDRVQGRTYNVGGGTRVNLSLAEATRCCAEITGRRVAVRSDPATHRNDVRWYITDHAALTADTGWTPARDARAILEDLHRWMTTDHDRLAPVFAP